jgi:acyl-[acyl-carrier-protein] desaturase
MATMQAGYNSGGKNGVEALAYVSFQELATRIAHRNTGRMCGDPVAERLLSRVATDENLHMVFYRDLVRAAMEIDPDRTVVAIAAEVLGFQMPGTGIPQFTRKSVQIAKAGIYDLRIHRDEVVVPVLRHWKVFDRTFASAAAQQAQADLASHLEQLEDLACQYEARRAVTGSRLASLS